MFLSRPFSPSLWGCLDFSQLLVHWGVWNLLELLKSSSYRLAVRSGRCSVDNWVDSPVSLLSVVLNIEQIYISAMSLGKIWATSQISQ
jgi:hypothetical protein